MKEQKVSPEMAKAMNKFVEEYLKKYKIKVQWRGRKSGGVAYIEEKLIKTPVIDCVANLHFALHEIKHIIEGTRKVHGRKVFENEYDCEMFALNEAAKFLGHVDQNYLFHAVWYVMFKFARAFNRGYKYAKVEQQIKSLMKYDESLLEQTKELFVAWRGVCFTVQYTLLDQSVIMAQVYMDKIYYHVTGIRGLNVKWLEQHEAKENQAQVA